MCKRGMGIQINCDDCSFMYSGNPLLQTPWGPLLCVRNRDFNILEAFGIFLVVVVMCTRAVECNEG